jgi:hypothetical protein
MWINITIFIHYFVMFYILVIEMAFLLHIPQSLSLEYGTDAQVAG